MFRKNLFASLTGIPVRPLVLAAFFLCLTPLPGFADGAGSPFPGGGLGGTRIEPVDTGLLPSHASFKPGKSYPLLLEMRIKDGYHTNSHTPSGESLIPVEAEFAADREGVTIGRINYPPEEIKKFSFAKEPLSVYEGTVYIRTSITFPDELEGAVTVTSRLRYQACTDQVCLMPGEEVKTVRLEIGKEGEKINREAYQKGGEGAHPSGAGKSEFDSASGLGLIFLVFIGGLALNLTPCVYPIIPITIGYFGATTGRPKGEIVIHAFTYLLGMAVMYSALGTFAALTGSLFGEMMQNTFVILFLVGVMALLSLSMFGFYEIKVPTALLNFSSKSYGGLFGTFFMGLTVGIVAAPCVGPFVIGLLTFVGEKQDPFLGFILFFVLAVGLGLPFVALAIFSGAAQNLPRSGDWMEWVRKFFGVVLLGMALYFAQPLIPSKWLGLSAMLLLIAGAVYLFRAGSGKGGTVFKTFRVLIPAAMLVAAMGVYQTGSAVKEGLHFQQYKKELLAEARNSGLPQVVYFTADWCVPCRELKLFTFSDVRVIKLQNEIAPLMVDATKLDQRKKELKKEFGVKGVPTIIIYDGKGVEVKRFTGFIPAEEFLSALGRAGVK